MSCNTGVILKLSGIILGILGAILGFYIEPHILNVFIDPHYQSKSGMWPLLAAAIMFIGIFIFSLSLKYD